MSQYAKELKFYEQFKRELDSKELKKSDIEIEGDDATIYDDYGKHFFEWREDQWLFCGNKEW